MEVAKRVRDDGGGALGARWWVIKGDRRELDPRWMAHEGSWSETQLSMGARSCNNWWGLSGDPVACNLWRVDRSSYGLDLSDLMQLFETGGVVGREGGRWVWWVPPKGIGEGLISGFAPLPHTLISN